MFDQFIQTSKWGAAVDALPSLNAAGDKSTVSGLSSGGFMAVQLHVAYSDVFKGVGVFAGGPFYCAQDKEMTALTSCMSSPMMIQDSILENSTDKFASSSTIESTSNLEKAPVYMFSGTKDYTVFTGVMDKLEDYYMHYNAEITYENSIAANHAVPTDLARNTNACGFLGKPFINNCDYDGAGEMFKTILPEEPKERDLDWEKHGKVVEFDQTEFITGNSMDETGYVYIPDSCASGKKKCGIHVALHGCKQGKVFVGDTFAKDSGYLEWAGVNDIIALFPQATKTSDKTNPNGCWDWWGYTNSDYSVKNGPQMAAIVSMMERLESAPKAPALSMGSDLFSGFSDFGDFQALVTLMATMLAYVFGN